MTALGFGAAGGVIGLLAIQAQPHRDQIFPLAVIGTGAFLILAASLSEPVFAALAVAVVGACAGTSYSPASPSSRKPSTTRSGAAPSRASAP